MEKILNLFLICPKLIQEKKSECPYSNYLITDDYYIRNYY